MAIKREEVERDAKRYDREDDPKVRRLADELDQVERRATGPLAGGAEYPKPYGNVGRMPDVLPDGTPAPFYGQPQPALTAGKAVAAAGAYPKDFERYIPPAQRVMMDADAGIMDADVEAWNMQSEDEKTRSYGKLALQNYDWVPQKDKAGIMDADSPDADWTGGQLPDARTAAPSARFPDEPSWAALSPQQQQMGYQMQAGMNNQGMVAAPADERAAYLEGLAPELRTDEYMRLSNPQVLPDGSPAPSVQAGMGPPPQYPWATQRERVAMQRPPPQQQQRPRFDAFHLNEGVGDLTQAYADAVRGGYR